MDYATFSWARDRLQIIPIMWDQKENYASNGFAIAFALNVPMAKVARAEGLFRQGDRRRSPGQTLAPLVVPEEKPDIIMVMSKSFWDPTCLPGDTITPDPIPTVRALQLRPRVLAGIRRHDRQCRIRGADRLLQRLPALRQHPLPAICAHAGAVAGDVPEERGLRDARLPSLRRLVLEPRVGLSTPSASTASCRRKTCRCWQSAGRWPSDAALDRRDHPRGRLRPSEPFFYFAVTPAGPRSLRAEPLSTTPTHQGRRPDERVRHARR